MVPSPSFRFSPTPGPVSPKTDGGPGARASPRLGTTQGAPERSRAPAGGRGAQTVRPPPALKKTAGRRPAAWRGLNKANPRPSPKNPPGNSADGQVPTDQPRGALRFAGGGPPQRRGALDPKDPTKGRMTSTGGERPKCDRGREGPNAIVIGTRTIKNPASFSANPHQTTMTPPAQPLANPSLWKKKNPAGPQLRPIPPKTQKKQRRTRALRRNGKTKTGKGEGPHAFIFGYRMLMAGADLDCFCVGAPAGVFG